jgi:hypothetical protein
VDYGSVERYMQMHSLPPSPPPPLPDSPPPPAIGANKIQAALDMSAYKVASAVESQMEASLEQDAVRRVLFFGLFPFGSGSGPCLEPWEAFVGSVCGKRSWEAFAGRSVWHCPSGLVSGSFLLVRVRSPWESFVGIFRRK